MTNQELKRYISVNKKWLSIFMRLTNEYSNPFEWWYDDSTKKRYQLISENSQTDLLTLIQFKGDSIFFSINEKRKIAVQINIGNQNFKHNYCYLTYWDVEEKNYPFLVYIVSPFQNNYREFVDIFAQFMSANTPELLNNFNDILKIRFKHTTKIV